MTARDPRNWRRRGITLTEILIAIMILGVGLVSLATLFPIGLLRLRDATRSTRTAYLTESAAADTAARGLLTESSFPLSDGLNLLVNPLNPPYWYYSVWWSGAYQSFDPTGMDTASYGGNIYLPNSPPPNTVLLGLDSTATTGYGLPFAYDPLWRYQTVSPTTGVGGYYIGDVFEARFASGIGFIRQDPTDGGLPSAHGLQRLTNFNRPAVMPSANAVPYVFVSPEDVVWVESLASNSFSPVLPDLSLPSSLNVPCNDWKYSWMFTGYKISSAGGSSFEGSIVIFENRPFGIDAVPNPPGPPIPTPSGTYQVEGETVVEAIFGHSGNIVSVNGGPPGFGSGADRAVLLRWFSSQSDPIVKPGDWIADVTYERQFPTMVNRFLNGGNPAVGVTNILNNGEWDNLPAQRCFWYQVQKVIPAIDDLYSNNNPPMRSMVVYVDRSLNARTVLNGLGQPVHYDAALISPYVVNVIPQSFVN
jgi:type II secretory pathway pseudopilin PulG